MKAALAAALVAGALAGAAYPSVDLALACRQPSSEACVWGKAYFPFTLGLSLVLVGGVTATVVYLLLRRRSKEKRPGEETGAQR